MSTAQLAYNLFRAAEGKRSIYTIARSFGVHSKETPEGKIYRFADGSFLTTRGSGKNHRVFLGDAPAKPKVNRARLEWLKTNGDRYWTFLTLHASGPFSVEDAVRWLSPHVPGTKSNVLRTQVQALLTAYEMRLHPVGEGLWEQK